MRRGIAQFGMSDQQTESDTRTKRRISFGPATFGDAKLVKEIRGSPMNYRSDAPEANIDVIQKASRVKTKVSLLDSNQLLDTILKMQDKMHKQYQRNEHKYKQVLGIFNKDLENIREHSKFINVENGRTVKAYLNFREDADQVARTKQIRCLTLLENYAQSTNTTRATPVSRQYDENMQYYSRSRNILKRNSSNELKFDNQRRVRHVSLDRLY